MLVLNFKRWTHSAKRWFKYDRIYLKGYIWTPFVKMQKR